MAIEIITRGVPAAEQKYHVICRQCRSSLSFLRRDANYQPDQRDGDYLWIMCPVCSSAITHHLKGK